MNPSSPPPRTVHVQAVLGLLLANLLWGLSFAVIKALAFTHHRLLPDSGNWFIAAYSIAPRFSLAALVLLVVLWRHLRSFTAAEWKQGLWLGLSTGLGMLFQNDGLQFTSASTSAFLTQVYAILIPAWLAVRAGRLPPPREILCALLVLAGVAILGRFDWQALRFGRGEWETLLSSLFYMQQILVLGRPDFVKNRPLPVSLVMFAVQAVLFAVMAAATAPRLADLAVPWTSGPWLVFTLLLTTFCTLGSFLLMNRWQPKISPTEAGLIYTIEPVFASLMALFLPALFSAWVGFDYPNETVTWHLLVGGALILGANVVLQLRPP